jgi:hypothetical protein
LVGIGSRRTSPPPTDGGNLLPFCEPHNRDPEATHQATHSLRQLREAEGSNGFDFFSLTRARETKKISVFTLTATAYNLVRLPKLVGVVA